MQNATLRAPTPSGPFHSDPKLTMKIYTDAAQLNFGATITNLPSIELRGVDHSGDALTAIGIQRPSQTINTCNTDSTFQRPFGKCTSGAPIRNES